MKWNNKYFSFQNGSSLSDATQIKPKSSLLYELTNFLFYTEYEKKTYGLHHKRLHGVSPGIMVSLVAVLSRL